MNSLRVVELVNIGGQARTRLIRLDSATSLEDLGALRGNRLKALSGNRKGQFSIRINDQFRICFNWERRDRPMSQSPAITKNGKKLPAIHPRSILLEDIKDEEISIDGLAQAMRVPANRISLVVNGRRGITADTAAASGVTSGPLRSIG
jgi:plasmid maintenance system killer protein